MALQVGDKIPEILGNNQDGEVVKAAEYAGKKLVLYFFPKIALRVVQLKHAV